MVPPVPIPNTVVKHVKAESTWLETAREDRKLPVKMSDTPFGVSLFLLKKHNIFFCKQDYYMFWRNILEKYEFLEVEILADDNKKQKESARTVKTEILMFVLPIVAAGLIILSGVVFKYMGQSFEDQLVTSSLSTASEVSEGVSAWLDARMLETQTAASHPAARNLDADLMNQNNLNRLKLMNKVYPGVYDSVSWGPFDGSVKFFTFFVKYVLTNAKGGCILRPEVNDSR